MKIQNEPQKHNVIVSDSIEEEIFPGKPRNSEKSGCM